MKRSSLILVLGVALTLAACSSQTRLDSDLGVAGAPDWVNKGSAYVANDSGRLFHGVGSAGVVGDASLQRSVADDRARAELARIFSNYLDVASADYQAAAKSGKDTQTDESVSRQIKSVSQLNLSGARIIARWQDKKTNTLWSIAEIDLKQFKEALSAAREMNSDAKRYLSEHGDNVFDRVREEKK
jgi:hypothetical protein